MFEEYENCQMFKYLYFVCRHKYDSSSILIFNENNRNMCLPSCMIKRGLLLQNGNIFAYVSQHQMHSEWVKELKTTTACVEYGVH